MPTSPVAARLMKAARVDLAPRHGQPSWLRWCSASVVALVGSLAVDALLVAMARDVFPSTKHYVHFQFSDYSRLTVIGVVVACLAWPIVTRISSAPRWMFLRMAVVITVVLWLPDLYILHQGQSPRAVAVLMCMHLAVALVTYNSLIRIAPVRVDAAPRGSIAASDEQHRVT